MSNASGRSLDESRAAITQSPAAIASATAATDPPPGAGSAAETSSRKLASDDPRYSCSLAEPDNLAVLVDVDDLSRRVRGESGHRAHVAADEVHETSAYRCTRLAHRHPPAGRSAPQGRVRRKGQMRLGDDDWHLAKAVLLICVDLSAGYRQVVDPVSTVDLRGDSLDLLAKRCLVRVEQAEVVLLVGSLDHGLRELRGSLCRRP